MSTLSTLVLLMAGLANSKPAQIQQGKWMMWSLVLLQIVVLAAAIRKVLIRHTVSASTAPTQASSTMQALATLGVVKAEGSTRNPVYKLTNHPVVEKLEVLLKAA